MELILVGFTRVLHLILLHTNILILILFPLLRTPALTRWWNLLIVPNVITGSTNSEGTIVSYQWDFDYDAGEGFTVDSIYKGNATTTYATSEPYTIRLRITDDIGTCSADRTVNVTLPLPEWEEVAP